MTPPAQPGRARTMIQVKLPRELVLELKHLAVDLDVYMQDLVEDLVRRGLAQFRQEQQP